MQEQDPRNLWSTRLEKILRHCFRCGTQYRPTGVRQKYCPSCRKERDKEALEKLRSKYNKVKEPSSRKSGYKWGRYPVPDDVPKDCVWVYLLCRAFIKVTTEEALGHVIISSQAEAEYKKSIIQDARDFIFEKERRWLFDYYCLAGGRNPYVARKNLRKVIAKETA